MIDAPGFAEVGCFENVWLEVVEFVPIHRDIGGVGIEGRGFDEVDRAPLGHLWRNIAPMLSVVGGDVNKSVVRAGPERSLFHRRFSERENGVVIFDRRDVVSQRAAAWLLLRFVVSRQVVADLASSFVRDRSI